MCEQTPVRQILIASVPAMSTSVTPGQFGFIFRRRRRLRRFVILPSDGSGGALIRIRCAARRRADRFIDRLSRLLISIFTPWSRASDILAGRTFTVSHKSPQNYRLVMKLLCREDHNGGASRSDVGDRRSKLGSEPLRTVGSPIPRQADLARPNGGPMANQLIWRTFELGCYKRTLPAHSPSRKRGSHVDNLASKPLSTCEI